MNPSLVFAALTVTLVGPGLVRVEVPPLDGFDRAILRTIDSPTSYISSDWSRFADWTGTPASIRGPWVITIDTGTLPAHQSRFFHAIYLP